MPDLAIPLRIAVIDEEALPAVVLRSILETISGVEHTVVLSSLDEAQIIVSQQRLNAIFIDIFSVGINESLAFISEVRSSAPHIAFCLYSTRSNLNELPGVPTDWKRRLSHYYKLPKHIDPSTLRNALDTILQDFALYIVANYTRRQLREARDLVSAEGGPRQLTSHDIERIISTTTHAEEALLARPRPRSVDPLQFLPGVSTDEVSQLLNRTLAQTQGSLTLNSRVNVGVLIFAAILLACSFLYGALTRDWQSLIFGGFGAVGLVASLVTNPLKSIGIAARRQVQAKK